MPCQPLHKAAVIKISYKSLSLSIELSLPVFKSWSHPDGVRTYDLPLTERAFLLTEGNGHFAAFEICFLIFLITVVWHMSYYYTNM